MNNKDTAINENKIREMLFDDEQYIREFCEAAMDSFREFSNNYETFLLDDDETNFRKNGHKMKPVAQMIGVDELVDEYEHAKTLLHVDGNREKRESSIRRIQQLSARVIRELETVIQ